MNILKKLLQNSALPHGLISGILITMLFNSPLIFFAMYSVGVIFGIALARYYRRGFLSSGFLITVSSVAYFIALKTALREVELSLGTGSKIGDVFYLDVILAGIVGAVLLTLGVNILAQSFSLKKNIIIALIGGILAIPFIGVMKPEKINIDTFFIFFPFFLWQSGMAWIISKEYPKETNSKGKKKEM